MTRTGGRETNLSISPREIEKQVRFLVRKLNELHGGTIISGFEYTCDDLSRIVEEQHLDKNSKFCYTYDNLNRVTKRTVKDLGNNVLSEESFTYDAAGNITDAPDTCFAYDTNNRLTVFCGQNVSYDLDGNMLSCGSLSFTYDSFGNPVRAWDLKTGNATLTQSRINKMQNQSGLYDIPILMAK